MSENSEQPLTITDVRKMSPIERIPFLGREWIIYPEVHQALNRVAEFHESGKVSDRSLFLMLSGPHAIGKTSLIHAYRKQLPPVGLDNLNCSMVVTSLPYRPSVGMVASQILDAMCDPLASKGTLEQKNNRIKAYFNKAHTEILVLDDYFGPSTGEDLARVKSAISYAAWLTKETGVSLMLVGANEDNWVFKFAEAAGLWCEAPVRLSPFTWNPGKTEECNFLWQEFLYVVESVLPLNEPSGLSTFEMAGRFFTAAKGNIGCVMHIVREAARLTLQEGKESLSLEQLAIAYDRMIWKPRGEYSNPFLENSSGHTTQRSKK